MAVVDRCVPGPAALLAEIAAQPRVDLPRVGGVTVHAGAGAGEPGLEVVAAARVAWHGVLAEGDAERIDRGAGRDDQAVTGADRRRSVLTTGYRVVVERIDE